MNEKQSIEQSIDLWEVLAADGTKRKIDVPGPWQDYLGRCPLCEFVADEPCSNCPAFLTQSYPGHCMNNNSPFRRWLETGSSAVKKRAAKQMVKLLKVALKKFI